MSNAVNMRSFLVALMVTSVVLAGCASSDDEPDDGSEQTDNGIPLGQGLGGDPTAIVMSVPPGIYNFAGPYSQLITKGTLGIQPAQLVNIPSPLGGSIEMGLYLPDTTEKV